MTPKFFEECVFFSTARITSGQPSGGSSIGTGFLCRADLGGDAGHVILLVSNKHVFQNPLGSLQFSFAKRDADGGAAIGESHSWSLPSFHSNYFAHPNPAVDLACINVSTYVHGGLGLFVQTIPIDMLSDFAEDSLLPGNEVWFVGYPDNRFDTKHNLPLLRRGYCASMPRIDFNGHPQFVIDAQVYPGSSGSPVFMLFGNQFKLVGVIAQTMVKHGQLTSIPAGHTVVGVQQVIGLGLVIKATALKVLLGLVTERIRTLRLAQNITHLLPGI